MDSLDIENAGMFGERIQGCVLALKG